MLTVDDTAEPYVFEEMACPDPEKWEDYLILEQIARQRFNALPSKFQAAYEDVLQRLRSAGMLAADNVLTAAGLHWKRAFEFHFIDC